MVGAMGIVAAMGAYATTGQIIPGIFDGSISIYANWWIHIPMSF